ncbi:MAG: hypothetical protein HY674_12190 [Chloroflexi bacterium]|nr:hypothetical protein [Chloroflexota bacterium]
MTRMQRVEYPGAIYHRGRIGAAELGPEDPATRRKNDPSKSAIAARLRQETTLTVKRIAARLHLVTSKSANARLQAWMRDETPANLAAEVAQITNHATPISESLGIVARRDDFGVRWQSLNITQKNYF